MLQCPLDKMYDACHKRVRPLLTRPREGKLFDGKLFDGKLSFIMQDPTALKITKPERNVPKLLPRSQRVNNMKQ